MRHFLIEWRGLFIYNYSPLPTLRHTQAPHPFQKYYSPVGYGSVHIHGMHATKSLDLIDPGYRSFSSTFPPSRTAALDIIYLEKVSAAQRLRTPANRRASRL